MFKNQCLPQCSLLPSGVSAFLSMDRDSGNYLSYTQIPVYSLSDILDLNPTDQSQLVPTSALERAKENEIEKRKRSSQGLYKVIYGSSEPEKEI